MSYRVKGREGMKDNACFSGWGKWTGMLFPGIGNTGGADLGPGTRSPVLDMLSLRSCRTSKLRCPESSCLHGSGTQAKDQDGKIWTRESSAF